MFHAGHAVARALHHRIVFLSTVGRRIRPGPASKIGFVRCGRGRDFAVDFDQSNVNHHRGAAPLHSCSGGL